MSPPRLPLAVRLVSVPWIVNMPRLINAHRKLFSDGIDAVIKLMHIVTSIQTTVRLKPMLSRAPGLCKNDRYAAVVAMLDLATKAE